MLITTTATATINTIGLIIVVTVLLVIDLGVTMIILEEVLQCGSITVPHATEILITIISI